jgi:hypothetical protein
MNGRSTFESGYMVTYASLGIPCITMDAIMDRVKERAGTMQISLPETQKNNGYSWMPAKIPDKSSPLIAFGLTGDNREIEFGPVANLLATSKKNLLCYVALATRLKRTRTIGAPAARGMEFGATIVGCQAVTLTDVASPPLNNRPTPTMVNIKISSDLEALNGGGSLNPGDGAGAENGRRWLEAYRLCQDRCEYLKHFNNPRHHK